MKIILIHFGHDVDINIAGERWLSMKFLTEEVKSSF
jgi:hypothetical protein